MKSQKLITALILMRLRQLGQAMSGKQKELPEQFWTLLYHLHLPLFQRPSIHPTTGNRVALLLLPYKVHAAQEINSTDRTTVVP